MRDYLLNMGILGIVGQMSDSGIAWLIGALAAVPTLLFCANQAKNLFTRKPAFTEQFREVKDCDERCAEANRRHFELSSSTDNRITAMANKSAASREKLYLRLTAVESELSALKKENELQTQHLYSLSQKIDRYIERQNER